MFCFPIVLKCVFVIYLLEALPLVLSRHKPHKTKYKIDEFIDKLLASKKFDALAERFAQKAVERMIDLKPELRFAKDFAAEVVPQKIPFNNVSYKTDVHLEETISPLKNLSLNFKHFTKGILYNSHSKEHEDMDETEASTANSRTTVLKKTVKFSEDNDKSTEKTINISDFESSLQDKSENKTETLKPTVHKEKEEYSNKNTTEKQVESDGSLSMENKKNAEFSSDNEISEHHKTNKSNAEVNSDFDKSVRKDRALFSDVSKEDLDSNNAKISKPRKKRIHREGNKVYTFQSSSDYDEYHQELERVEKERNVFV